VSPFACRRAGWAGAPRAIHDDKRCLRKERSHEEELLQLRQLPQTRGHARRALVAERDVAVGGAGARGGQTGSGIEWKSGFKSPKTGLGTDALWAASVGAALIL
jgi:hypothetical protein